MSEYDMTRRPVIEFQKIVEKTYLYRSGRSWIIAHSNTHVH